MWVLKGDKLVKEKYVDYKKVKDKMEETKSGGGIFRKNKNKGVVKTVKGDIILEHYQYVNGIVDIMKDINVSIEKFKVFVDGLLLNQNNTLDNNTLNQEDRKIWLLQLLYY